MKNTFRRLIAMVLLLGTIASFAVPATYADGGNGEIVYDFQLYNDSQFSGTIDGSGNKYSKAAVRTAISNAYANETHNWKFEELDATASRDDVKFFSAHAEGMRLTIGANKWVAFRLRVAEAGTYEVSLKSNNTNASYNYNATAWIVPAETGTMSATDIEASIVDGNKLGTAPITTQDRQAAFGEKTLEMGEYVLIMKVDVARASFAEIHLKRTGTAVPSETTQASQPTEDTTEIPAAPVSYDFQLYNDSQFSGTIDGSGNKYSKAAVRTAISNAYANETHNWKFEELDATASRDDVKFFSAHAEGMRLTIGANKWVAFRLRVAEAGTYEVSLKSNNTNASYNYNATAWIVPAETGTMSATDIEASIVDGNKLGTAPITTQDRQAAFGEKTLEMGEYVLIMKVDADRASFVSIDLTPKTEEPEPSQSTGAPETTEASETSQPTDTTGTSGSEITITPGVYELELYNYARYLPMFSSSNKFLTLDKGAYNALSGAYKKGDQVAAILTKDYPNILNWKIEATNDLIGFDKIALCNQESKGLRIQKYEANEAGSGWIAFRLAVPQAGLYNVNLVSEDVFYNHEAYFFPASGEAMSEESIEAQLTAQNLIGQDKLYMKPTTVTHKGVKIESAGEYILVLKMPETTKKTTIYLSQITLTEADPEVLPPVDPRPQWANQPGFFDMELYNYTGYGVCTLEEERVYTKYQKVRDAIESAYPQNINWKLEGYDPTLDWDEIQFVNDCGSRYGLRMKGAEGSTGHWMAFRVNNETAGKKELILRSEKGVYSGKVYLFPAPAETMTADAIAAAMTEENLAGKVSMTVDKSVNILTEKEFAVGEYIIVLQANKDKAYIDSISLTEVPVEVPKEPVDKMFYDFDLLSMDENFADKGFTNWYDPATKKVIVYEKVAQMYDEDIINWKYETISKGAKRFTFKPGNLRIKSGSNFLDLGDTWNALRIEAPGAGTYDIRLTSAEKSTAIADIYLIPARTGFAMKADEIASKMTEENLLVAGALLSGKDTFYLGEYTFGPEYEYILVFKCTRGKILYMSNMQITKDGLVADTEVKKLPVYNGVVYNFDIGDEFTGILQPLGEYRYDMPTPKEDGYKSPIEQINDFYRNGTLNWKWEMASDDLINLDENLVAVPNEYIRFYQENGMYVYGTKDSWLAFRIKSPGEGDFTLTMNHAVCPDSAVVAVYIIPADTPQNEIWQATDPANRIGKVVLTNEDGSAGKEDGHESFIGYYNFEAGKEYILVLEAYTASGFNNLRANMNISNIVMQKGIHEYKTEETKTVKPVTVSPNILNVQDSGQGCTAVWEANGMDYYAVHLEGGGFYVYNLDTQELVDEQYWNTTRPRNMVIAPDGKIWIIATWKYVICYDPVTKTFEKTAAFMPDYKYNGFNYGTITEDGTLYLTQHLSGHLIKYDPKTKKYTDLGIIYPGANSCDALVYREGYLYVNCGYTDKFNSVVKYNIATNQVEGAYNYIDLAGNSNAYAMTLLGNEYVAVGVSTNFNECAITVDMKTMELVDLGLPGAINRGVTEEIDGKQYIIVTNYGLYEYDVATREVSKVTGFESMSGSGFRSGGVHSYGKSWVTLNGDFCLISNTSQVRCCPRIINMDKREYYEWTDLTRDVLGGGTDIISFTNGAENSGELIMGFYNAHHTATYNIHTGEITSINVSAGQTDSILWYKDILYAGCYSATVLVEIDRQRDEMLQRFKLDHEATGQKRLLNMTAGDDRVFVGSIPETGVVGGAITTYNTLTGQWHMHRNVVQDQSIIDMVHHDGVLFGASSRKNGDNTELSGDSAVIIAYDYVNYEVLATLDPRDFIPGLKSPVHFVYGLGVDPNADENGRIWGMVAEVLFCFTYDKETRTFDAQVVKDFGHTSYNSSSGVDRHQNQTKFIYENGQIIAMFKTAGIYAFTLEDWDAPVGEVQVATSQRIMGYRPEDFIIAEDNNLYFANGGNLMMLPMNVTDEDWAIAEDIDQQIKNLGQITLESEAAVKSARSAYDNTTWRYRALVQNVELLQEAECDLLECLIDEAILKAGEIDADDYPAMLELHEEYEDLGDRQKRYVKNYKALKEAYELSSSLNDQRCAAAMQEKVNALKDIMPIETLEKEPQVVAVRTEFDALPGRQRILVDTKILEEAEAQIAVLRAELVKQVEALIQAIPEEITLEAEPAIIAAREGVDKLTALERKQVSYSKLEASEAKLRNLKNALEKAQQFDAMMKEIGIVTLADAQRIANARQFYNSLNETARAFAKKAGKLNRAEFILKGLQTWMIPAIVVADLGAAFAVVWFVPSLHNKVFKTKKKEEEPAEN